MDRNEYKAKLDEIKKLVNQGKKEEALELLRSENWKKVPNVNILLQAGELFEVCDELEEAKDLLELGHERSPIGRMIIFRLAMIAVKMNNLDAAKDYYDEFVEIAPHDSMKYIIRYEINRAKGADINTLISVLEELKASDFMEEWAYELARLYHKAGEVNKCIDLCDEIILWFGDGPYVERALELKMLYHPLDKNQEDKYRLIQQKKDGITEIYPGEEVGNNEILHKPIQIPEVEVSSDKFNTVNLQAEIQRNIEEIMQATESAEIDENLEAIKGLVEDIPYLRMKEEELPDPEEKKEEDKKLDETLKHSFQEYLTEAHDGQVSFILPEFKGDHEPPMKGQMTIEEVMENWEKTRAAAKAALDEAEQIRFEQTKARAITAVTQIMDRLEEVSPKLDAGMTPRELLKEEYLSKVPTADTEEKKEEPSEKTEEIPRELIEEQQALKENRTFPIPRVKEDGDVLGVGLEIPVVTAAEVGAVAETVVPALTHDDTGAPTWTPPELEGEKEEQASDEEEELPKIDVTEILAEEDDAFEEDATEILEEDIFEEDAEEESDEDAYSEVENDSEMRLADSVAELLEKDEKQEEPKPELTKEQKEQEDSIYNGSTIDLAKLAPDVVVDAPIKEEEVAVDTAQHKLTEEEKEIFSYFTPITGMEENLCQALTGLRKRFSTTQGAKTGNLIIFGGKGSGKTTLATNIIKVLQDETGKPSGNVGKIDGKRLNEKDIKQLFAAVSGGCLIIEEAGQLTTESAVTLSLLMENDTSGIIVIMEDTKENLQRLLNANVEYAKRFTERINIPVLTIDELVNFGKVYALELGYNIDEMGVLALYDRINIRFRPNHPVYVTGVKEIVDEAIDHAERGGLSGFFGRLGGKHYDDDGNLILQEKDFQDE